MIVYLCGKMTGLPDYNYPQFHAWAKRLRDAGHTVRNPAEEFDGDQSRTRSEYMRRAYSRIIHYGPANEHRLTELRPCEAIAVLSSDYATSDGSFFELHLALIHKIPVWWADDLTGQLLPDPWDESVLRSFINPPSARIPLDPPSVRVVQHEAGTQPVGGEVRVVDPDTGGEKGTKLARYGLVPMRAWDKLTYYTDMDANLLLATLRLDNFIMRKDEDTDNLGRLGGHLIGLLRGQESAFDAVAEVYGYGAQKYQSRNWERGYCWELSVSACYRHLRAYRYAQECDPESGLPHLAHALFHVLALLTFVEHYPEKDDRSALYKGGE